MKNIDNDIEQFEKNLVEIDAMSNQISELKSSLEKILKETRDIENIKDGINKEIESIHKTNESTGKQVDEKIKALNEITTDVKNSIGKDADKIVKPIKEDIYDVMNKMNQVSESFSKSVDDIREKQNTIEKKLQVVTIIMVIGFLLTMLLIFMR